MRKLILLSLLVILFSNSFAQKDANAEKILAKVSETYKSYDSFRIKFSLTIENVEEKIKETSLGVADIKGERYKINIMNAETYFDGKTRYTYLKDSQEVNISTPEESDAELANPAKIFSLYKNGFKYSLAKEYIKDGVSIAEIILEPVKEKDYSKIVLLVDKKTSRIISFMSVGKEGNNITLKMTNIDINQNFENSYFIFNTKSHPGVEIIDMR